MQDTPTSGPTVSDADIFADSMSVLPPGAGGEYTAFTTLSFQLAVSSPNSDSTVTIACETASSTANGGTLAFGMYYGVITAVQTSVNG
jgi:hypothetical protein